MMYHSWRDSNGLTQGATGATGYVKSHEAGGAKSGAIPNDQTTNDPELAQIVAAWPRLADPIRRAVLALISAGDK
jgi:hypothetical protein